MFEQEGIRIFNTLQIRYYGLIIVAAMLVAAFIASRLARRDRRDPEHVWGALTWAIIPGIILARLWFVIFPPISSTLGCTTATTTDICRDTAWYLANVADLTNGPLAIWSGGLSIFGAVLGGLLGMYLYLSHWHNPVVNVINRFWWVGVAVIGALLVISNLSAFGTAGIIGIILLVIVVLWFIPFTRKILTKLFGGDMSLFPDSGLKIGPWLDIAAVALPLAQAIGRWANYVNQELFGSVTTLPWGIPIDAAHRVAPYGSTVDYPVATTLFHPLFLYESLLCLVLFVVLLNCFNKQRQRLFPGDIFLFYLIGYGAIRFVLEFLRVDVTTLGGVNWSQVVTGAAVVGAAFYFVYRHRAGAPALQRLPDPVVHKPAPAKEVESESAA